jgi:hypothetical protein
LPAFAGTAVAAVTPDPIFAAIEHFMAASDARRLSGNYRAAIYGRMGGFASWGHGIKDGWYCHAHAEAIEQVNLEGGLDDPENDL